MSVPDTSPRLIFLQKFQTELGLSFKNPFLLESALTHRSTLNERIDENPIPHNERLEFLGDAVLGLAVASILYGEMDGMPEGQLSRVKSIVVSEQTLAETAIALGIPGAMLLGRGEELSGGRKKKALLADALEALLGALFLDQGYEKARDFVVKILSPAIRDAIVGQSKDFKTIVQEYAQKYLKGMPRYEVNKTEGPEHARIFWVSCRVGDKEYGPFRGTTKKEAEQLAAENVFKSLKEESPLAASRLASIAGPSGA